MKGIAILAATAAVLSLAGCNRTGTVAASNMTANAAMGNSAAPKAGDTGASNQAAPQTADAGKLNSGGGAVPASSTGTSNVRLDRTFIMGRWTDDNDCSKAVEFTQDGRFINADNSSGLWNLDGDQLTMSGNGTLHMRIQPIDQNTITVIHDDGSLGRSTRC